MPRHTPLTTCEMIPDSLLRRLRADSCGTRRKGRLSEEDAAVLCMILPDLCGELIARRAAQGCDDTTRSVKTEALRRLALETPARAGGTLNPREHRYLALTLPAICDELLHLRRDMSYGSRIDPQTADAKTTEAAA